MSDLVTSVRRHRTAVSVAFDAAAWIVAFLGFTWLRYDGVTTDVPWELTLVVAVVTTALFVVVGRVLLLHHGRSRVASLEEMLRLGTIVLGVGLVVTVANLVFQWLPRSVPPTAAFGALVLMAWARAAWRRWREIDDERLHSEGATRVLVVGAGEAGRELIGSMYRDPLQQWRPVGLLDDDPAKRRRRVRQVPVVGTTPGWPRRPPTWVRPPSSSPCPAPRPPPSTGCASWPSRPSSRSRCCPPAPSCSTTRSGSATCVTSTSPTSWAATSSTPTWPRSPATSPAAGAGHRRRRLHRLRAVPPDPPLRARPS